jgi:hypothetical protein
MIHHVTFTNEDMTRSATVCTDSAYRHGCDTSVTYLPGMLGNDFYQFNKSTLEEKRGAGYWLWKPYAILSEMLTHPDGEIIMYTDAGVEIIEDVNIIGDRMQDVWLFGNNYQHRHWCKGFVTREISGYVPGNQVQASAMFFRVNERSINFVKEWLLWCQMPGFIDDSPSKDNDPEFQEHRHDQAILTCVAQNKGAVLHWWPASYNNGAFHYDKGTYTDDYPVMFNHHRKRNNEWT